MVIKRPTEIIGIRYSYSAHSDVLTHRGKMVILRNSILSWLFELHSEIRLFLGKTYFELCDKFIKLGQH